MITFDRMLTDSDFCVPCQPAKTRCRCPACRDEPRVCLFSVSPWLVSCRWKTFACLQLCLHRYSPYTRHEQFRCPTRLLFFQHLQDSSSPASWYPNRTCSWGRTGPCLAHHRISCLVCVCESRGGSKWGLHNAGIYTGLEWCTVHKFEVLVGQTTRCRPFCNETSILSTTSRVSERRERAESRKDLCL